MIHGESHHVIIFNALRMPSYYLCCFNVLRRPNKQAGRCPQGGEMVVFHLLENFKPQTGSHERH